MIRQCCLIVLTIAVAYTGLAQISSSAHVSVRQLPIGSELPSGWLQQVVTELDRAKLRPIVSGSWEGQLVDIGREAGSLILHRDLRAATGY